MATLDSTSVRPVTGVRLLDANDLPETEEWRVVDAWRGEAADDGDWDVHDRLEHFAVVASLEE